MTAASKHAAAAWPPTHAQPARGGSPSYKGRNQPPKNSPKTLVAKATKIRDGPKSQVSIL